MEGETIEDVLELFPEICIDNSPDSDKDDYSYTNNVCKSPLPQALQDLPPPAPEIYIDFEKYILEKCHNRLTILDRSTFHQIERPIIIAFNHFREMCYYHTKWLDRIYQLSLNYGDHIEFIVADKIDMNVMYPHSNPINCFSTFVRPQDENPNMYAIDAHKRIHEYFDCYKTVENLSELCEQLLTGNLFPSQPLPEKNDTFVKICVHQNYDELVTKSTKDVFLIVGVGDYRACEEHEPNYEEIAEKLKDSNVDIVYIDGDKNYVPFKFMANCYPTLLFLPHKDKDNFIHFSRASRDTKNVMDFLQDNTSLGAESRRQLELSSWRYKLFTLPEDTVLNFEDLKQYINENFPKSLKVLDRNTFKTIKEDIIIHFMDFSGNGVASYLQTLQTIYQVAQAKYCCGVEYLIADLNDVDVVYPQWYTKYLADMEIDKSIPQVFAIDRLKRTYKVDAFKTASSLFYYSSRLNHTENFYSQFWTTCYHINTEVVKTCVAHNLNICIQNTRTNIFLTIHWGTEKDYFKILKVLDEIVPDAKSMYVQMMKLNAKLNYVPLEYSYPTYPVHFFIPHHHKDTGTIRYISDNQSKEELLEFIRTNVQQCQ